MKKRYFLICGLITLAVLVAGMVTYPHLPDGCRHTGIYMAL
jgi:hypothetical protein